MNDINPMSQNNPVLGCIVTIKGLSGVFHFTGREYVQEVTPSLIIKAEGKITWEYSEDHQDHNKKCRLTALANVPKDKFFVKETKTIENLIPITVQEVGGEMVTKYMYVSEKDLSQKIYEKEGVFKIKEIPWENFNIEMLMKSGFFDREKGGCEVYHPRFGYGIIPEFKKGTKRGKSSYPIYVDFSEKEVDTKVKIGILKDGTVMLDDLGLCFNLRSVVSNGKYDPMVEGPKKFFQTDFEWVERNHKVDEED